MDKILQFLKLFFILEVVSSLECYLKPLSDKKCEDIDIQMGSFDQNSNWDKFTCSNKGCHANISFFNDSEFQTYFSTCINGTMQEIYIFENGNIKKTETEGLEDHITEQRLAVVHLPNDLLVIRNTTNNVYFTATGLTDSLYFSLINNNEQYIIKRIKQGRYQDWLLLNVRKFSKENLEIFQKGNKVLLMSTTHVYELTNSKENICIGLRDPYRFRCSESHEIRVDPNSFIRNGQTKIFFSNQDPKSKVFLYSALKREICKININDMSSCLIPEWTNEEEVTFAMITPNGKLFRSKFHYLNNPEVTVIPSADFYNWTNYNGNCTSQGVIHVCNEKGNPLVFQGRYFNNLKSISITPEGLFQCSDNATAISCYLDNYQESIEAVLKLDTIEVNFNYTLYDNPVLKSAEINDSSKNIEVYGKRLDVAATTDDYRITVNDKYCSITSLKFDKLECQLNANVSEDSPYYITVILQQRIFNLKFARPKKPPGIEIIIGAVCGLLLLMVIILAFVKYRKKQQLKYGIDSHLTMGLYKNPDIVDQICRLDVTEIDVPFQKITQYIEQILLIDKPRRYKKNPGGKKLPFDIQEKLGHFEVLLKNKFFILNIIKAMDRKKNICYNENYELSLHLCLLLSFNLGFLLEICEELFKDLIHQTKEKERKNIMLRFESIAESIMKNWLALSMYPYIKFKFEPLLFHFVNEVRHFLTQGPVDEVTGNSQYYFFKSYSISKPIEHRKIDIQLSYKRRRVHVSVLSCDSIPQLKNKCLVAYQAENINCPLPSVENIQMVYNGYVLQDYTEETDSNGCSLMATVDTYGIKDGYLLCIEKVVMAATADIETRYVTLGASVTVAPKEVSKSCHLVAREKRKALSTTDFNNMKLPAGLEDLLLGLFSKMLDQANVSPPLKYIHNFFVHQASKFSLNDGSQWTINSYVIQMCSQFISHPNILLDIPLDLCVKKNLSALQLYMKEVLSRPKTISSKTCQVGKEIYAIVSRFISQLNEQPEVDKNVVITSLQEASALYTNGITIYKEISLYSLLRIVENNYVVVYKALENDETARKLCLHEKFSNIFH